MQWLAAVRGAVASLAAIWRRQDGFGRVLMAVGAANVAACLLLGLGLLVFSVMPWRGALASGRTALRVPTTAPTLPRPTSAPRPTDNPTPSATPTPTASPTSRPTRTPTAAPTRQPEARIEVQARMSDATPSRNSRVTVYGRITKDGQGIAGVPMRTIWALKSANGSCEGRSDERGLASCSLRLGKVSKGTEVRVQVIFRYEGQDYTATTFFRVR